jgi:hypothetical protein
VVATTLLVVLLVIFLLRKVGTRLHGVITRKIIIRIFTAAKTSNIALTAVSTSSIGARTGYELEGSGFLSWHKQEILFTGSHQNGSGAHPANYAIGTGEY